MKRLLKWLLAWMNKLFPVKPLPAPDPQSMTFDEIQHKNDPTEKPEWSLEEWFES